MSNEEIKKLNMVLGSLEEKIDQVLDITLDTRKSFFTMQDTVKTLEGTVSGLQGSVGGMQSSVTDLQGVTGTLQTSISSMQGSITTLQDSVSELQGSTGILHNTVDMIGRTVASILATMATKDDMKALWEGNFSLQTQINDLSTDLRSFKQDTQKNFDIVGEKIDDLYDTVMNHDTRIERLETKFT